MSLSPEPALRFVGGRLALDFVNMVPARGELSWDQLIAFLQSAHIITAERGGELLALSRSDPQSAESLLRKAQRLASALRMAFEALLHRHRIASEWVAPVNEILRVTEGHDELVPGDRDWKIEFVAREGGLEWLLAAVARSAAEMSRTTHSRGRIGAARRTRRIEGVRVGVVKYRCRCQIPSVRLGRTGGRHG